MEETKFSIVSTINVKEKNDNNSSCHSYKDRNLIISNKTFDNDNDLKIYEEPIEPKIINLKKIENNDLIKSSKLLYNGKMGSSPEKEEYLFKSINLIEDNDSSKNKKEISIKSGEKNE